jgi:peptide/nickel transport system substrate-binding protein
MDRKNSVIMILISLLILSGISNIILYFVVNYQEPIPYCPCGYNFVMATSAGPRTLEPVDSWDSASNDVLEQVVETLFSYDFHDVNLPRTNHLAYSYWWKDNVTLQIRLREGILFHDGTPFDADVAKWNLDRLQYLTNCSGTNKGEVAHTQSLWMLPDGRTPIMKEITTMGEYNITITLNNPYGPLLNTLAYINAGMISPTSHRDYSTNFIDLSASKLIGTGPFKYGRFIPNVEVRLERWDHYWRAPAKFEIVIFAIYSDANTAHNAFLSYSIDANPMASYQQIAQYEVDPKLTVKRFSDDTGKLSLVYQYLGFNNKNYNVTLRKAMSYAINYTYVIEELRYGNAFRAKSPISPGFGHRYNESLKGVEYNLTKAREIMISMGFGNVSWTDAQWISVAEGYSPFLTIEYTYHIGNTFRSELGVAITEWFKLIGIAVVDDGYDWTIFVTGGVSYDGMFCVGWGLDYLDCFNMLEPLFNPTSGSNICQVNDSQLNSLMALALETTDDVVRNIIYKDIQSYISEVGFFHAPLYHPKIVSVHMANIYGVPYNAMGALRFYPMYRGLFSPFNPLA